MVNARTSYMAHRDGEMPEDGDPLLAFEPAPHSHPRKNSITADRQRAFIAHLAATGIVAEAAAHIGASLEALYKLRHKPGAEGFAAAWDEAVERGVLRIEHGALQRAIEGVEKPIVTGGKLLGWHRVHNEGLVMFLLRQRRPALYGHVPTQKLRPGHPEYERIRHELKRREPDIEEVRAEIMRKVEAIKRARERKWCEAFLENWPTGRPAIASHPALGRPDGED
jgi:hypothetical protein